MHIQYYLSSVAKLLSASSWSSVFQYSGHSSIYLPAEFLAELSNLPLHTCYEKFIKYTVVWPLTFCSRDQRIQYTSAELQVSSKCAGFNEVSSSFNNKLVSMPSIPDADFQVCGEKKKLPKLSHYAFLPVFPSIMYRLLFMLKILKVKKPKVGCSFPQKTLLLKRLASSPALNSVTLWHHTTSPFAKLLQHLVWHVRVCLAQLLCCH